MSVPAAREPVHDPSLELASRRTRLSFQRPPMSADRTLMSILRTSLSLIGFGFTIFQFFRFLRDSAGVEEKVHAARNFGMALLGIGIFLLTLGIVGHVRFMLDLPAGHDQFGTAGLIPDDGVPYSAALALPPLLRLAGQSPHSV